MTSNQNKMGLRYRLMAFTEQGVAMEYQTPENWTESKRRDGHRTEELKKASLPISANLFQKSRWLPARFISAIGREGLPFSTHKPRIPMEKSPVAELELPPEKPVMRMPLSMALSRPSRSLSP